MNAFNQLLIRVFIWERILRANLCDSISVELPMNFVLVNMSFNVIVEHVSNPRSQVKELNLKFITEMSSLKN